MQRVVLMFLFLCTVLSCSEPTDVDNGTPTPELLRGAPWILKSISTGNSSETPRAALTAQFTPDLHVSGAAGPNEYRGVYAANQTGSIKIDSLASTLIGGEEAELAAGYVQKMSRSIRFSASPTVLWLYTSEGEGLRFERLFLTL